MNADRYILVKEIFLAASHRPPTERASFLDDACGGDPEIRTEVESLLSHDESCADFMVTPALADRTPSGLRDLFETRRLDFGSSSDDDLDSLASSPLQIGKYKIIEVLGEGGMGVVYLAEQDNPRRQVALKIIRPGATSRDAFRRFEFEAQVLGRLQHSGIAQIYEAGTADTGGGAQPFYAMELVRGKRLDAYIESRRPGIRDRIELLIKICDAVHHAHQKGIIHRDLKPGNIVVTDGIVASAGQVNMASWDHGIKSTAPSMPRSHDASMPIPKILDFGVARAIGADDRQTIQTGTGQLIGTISYMSPEQVSGDPDDLDTRSDVFALGAIGFQMLCGELPHDFGRKSIAECARMIRDEDPRKLSAVDRTLRGDLETIFAKALVKERERRYQSASELAADLRRYLKHEPIGARPATPLYTTSRWIRRHRGWTAAIAITCALVGFLVIWANTAQIAERFRMVQGGATVAQGRNYATVITQVQLAISQMNRNQDRPSADILKQLLQTMAAQAADAEVARDDDGASRLLGTVGLGYQQLGMYGECVQSYQKALDLRQRITNGDDAALAEALHNLGRGHYWNSDYTRAEQFYRRALEMRIRLFGPRDLSVAMSMTHLATCLMQRGEYAQAEAMYRDVIDLRRAIPQTPPKDIGAAINNLGACLHAAGRYDEALALYRQGYDIIGDPADDLEWKPRCLRSMGMALIDLGRFDEADIQLSQALTLQDARLNRSQVALTQQQIGKLRLRQGRIGEAHQALDEALRIQEQMLVPEHSNIAESQLLLGKSLIAQGQPGIAENHIRQSLDIRHAKFPASHWLIADAQSVLGECLMKQGLLVEAEPLLRASLQVLRAVRPPSDWHAEDAARRVDELNERMKSAN